MESGRRPSQTQIITRGLTGLAGVTARGPFGALDEAAFGSAESDSVPARPFAAAQAAAVLAKESQQTRPRRPARVRAASTCDRRVIAGAVPKSEPHQCDRLVSRSATPSGIFRVG